MRRGYLIRSVRRLIDDDEDLVTVAYMWGRHRLMVPFVVAAFGALFVVAMIAGFETMATRVGIGVAGAAVAATATSDYRILAQTSEGLMLLRSSRIRQVATEIIRRLPDDTPIELVTSNMLASEWRVGDGVYVVAKNTAPLMAAMANA